MNVINEIANMIANIVANNITNEIANSLANTLANNIFDIFPQHFSLHFSGLGGFHGGGVSIFIYIYIYIYIYRNVRIMERWISMHFFKTPCATNEILTNPFYTPTHPLPFPLYKPRKG